MNENESYGNVYGGAFAPHWPELLRVPVKRFLSGCWQGVLIIGGMYGRAPILSKLVLMFLLAIAELSTHYWNIGLV